MLLGITCAAIFIVCIYGLAALVHEGPDRAHALRMVVGTITSYLVIYTVILK